MCIHSLAQCPVHPFAPCVKLRMLNFRVMLAKVVCVWAQAMTYRL